MKKHLLSLLVFAAFGAPVCGVEPFFAPSEPTGSMQVRLYPTEGVAAGIPHIVTFGVPFTRGSIADVSTVRVLKGGAEILANVQIQTPWRHMYSTAIDGKSVRVARKNVPEGAHATAWTPKSPAPGSYLVRVDAQGKNSTAAMMIDK
jgi:hypothetical protein